MYEMKFIVVESSEAARELFVFPQSIEYESMAKVVDYVKYGESHNWRRVKHKIIGQGLTQTNAADSVITSEMKYIATKSDEAGKQIFIFPKSIYHDRMADILHEIEELADGVVDNFYRAAVSAGFTDGKTCYGKSETLDLKSDKNDTATLLSGGSKAK
jgi:hypothetical protein